MLWITNKDSRIIYDFVKVLLLCLIYSVYIQGLFRSLGRDNIADDEVVSV